MREKNTTGKKPVKQVAAPLHEVIKSAADTKIAGNPNIVTAKKVKTRQPADKPGGRN